MRLRRDDSISGVRDLIEGEDFLGDRIRRKPLLPRLQLAGQRGKPPKPPIVGIGLLYEDRDEENPLHQDHYDSSDVDSHFVYAGVREVGGAQFFAVYSSYDPFKLEEGINKMMDDVQYPLTHVVQIGIVDNFSRAKSMVKQGIDRISRREDKNLREIDPKAYVLIPNPVGDVTQQVFPLEADYHVIGLYKNIINSQQIDFGFHTSVIPIIRKRA